METEYLSVSILTKYIKQKFDRDPYLERVFLKGEISNFNRNRPNSHRYFNLKDEGAKINAVMFRGVGNSLRFTPEEGMQVLVIGRLTLYEKTGVYQMIIEHMEPDGIGQLYQALEETKRKLREEGLFDVPRKQLARYPRKIAVITSPSGAVIRDIITTIKRRYPIVQLVLYPTLVQGDRAAESIVENIKRANETGGYDTIIMGRGGGSIEDLWPFNEEKVARAIFDSVIPIISSVGHETDTTLSDLVADVRAATPTAAAELAVPVLQDELLKIDQLKLRLFYSFQQELEKENVRLKRLTSSYVFRQPERLYESYIQNVDQLTLSLNRSVNDILSEKRQQANLVSLGLQAQHPKHLVHAKEQSFLTVWEKLERQKEYYMENKKETLGFLLQSLDFLSPLKILGRGFSYVTDEAGAVIKEEKQLSIGDTIRVHLHEGEIEANVIKKGENKHE